LRLFAGGAGWTRRLADGGMCWRQALPIHGCGRRMPRPGTGHMKRLPSGSYRVWVYAGTDPLTGRTLRYRPERQAQVVLAADRPLISAPPAPARR
jgi:hypothetical protein